MSVMTSDPTGRLFVNDQNGPLYSVGAGGGSVTEYLDLRDQSVGLISGGEVGFQSFAFHPDFATPSTGGFGKFYTLHSSNDTGSTPDFDPGGSTSFHTVLLEWQTSTPTASTFSPTVPANPFREVIRFKQPFGNHNGGLIAFNTRGTAAGTDRTNLYVAMGDGGSGNDPQGNGQKLGNPYGALLRIDPLGSDSTNGQYGIVAENAFASDGDAGTLAEIYSAGLRNPQRFGWDDASGNLFIADIGQTAVEEIDLAENGGNFGWVNREGSFANGSRPDDPSFIDPVAEYDHTNLVSDPPTSIGNRAITVGEVVRGSGIPGLNGNLLLGDFPTGLIFTLNVDTDPLAGGQDGLSELLTVDENGEAVRLLELINAERAARGLGSTSRADLRFSLGTGGEVFVLNKHDGIVRQLVAVPEPGTWVLVVGGLGIAGWAARRREQ